MANLDLATSQLSRPQELNHVCRYCNYSSPDRHQLAIHFRVAHHELLQCQECRQIFQVTEHLNQHAQQTKHRAFRCQYPSCDTTCTRLDDLRRHNRRHQVDAPRFTCRLCPQKSFGRQDHLKQHMRNWHRIEQLPGTSAAGRSCPHLSCPQYRDPNDMSFTPFPFAQSKDYIRHMRNEHNQSPFPCQEPGCDRVNGKGYFREVDLVKHQKKWHVLRDSSTSSESASTPACMPTQSDFFDPSFSPNYATPFHSVGDMLQKNPFAPINSPTQSFDFHRPS